MNQRNFTEPLAGESETFCFRKVSNLFRIGDEATLADSALNFEIESCARAWEGTALSLPDFILLEGLKTGHERSYEELIHRFQQPIYNLVYRFLDDPAEACDVVQEVFLKVFRSVTSFRGQSSLKTWIYRIAVNEAHNHRRWFGRRRGHEVGLEDEQGEGKTYEMVLPDSGRSPFEIALDNETHERIENAINRVKPAFREALILRDLEGMSYEEIADILQLNLGTVKSRILRGREALRVLLSSQEQNLNQGKLAWANQGAK